MFCDIYKSELIYWDKLKIDKKIVDNFRHPESSEKYIFIYEMTKIKKKFGNRKILKEKNISIYFSCENESLTAAYNNIKEWERQGNRGKNQFWTKERAIDSKQEKNIFTQRQQESFPSIKKIS